MRYSVKLMEASSPPNLFDSSDLCHMLVKAAASEYMCRDELYGRCLGIQVGRCMCAILSTVVFFVFWCCPCSVVAVRGQFSDTDIKLMIDALNYLMCLSCEIKRLYTDLRVFTHLTVQSNSEATAEDDWSWYGIL